MRLALVTSLQSDMFHPRCTCRLDLLPGSRQLPCFTQSTPSGRYKPSSCGQWLEGFTCKNKDHTLLAKPGFSLPPVVISQDHRYPVNPLRKESSLIPYAPLPLSCCLAPGSVWLPLLLFSIEGNLTTGPRHWKFRTGNLGVSHLKTQAILSTLPAP